MTRSELICLLIKKLPHISPTQITASVKYVFKHMSSALAQGQSLEIRGFGSIKLRQRQSRMTRNPKTGDTVHTPGKQVPLFKAGKALRARINSLTADQGLRKGT